MKEDKKINYMQASHDIRNSLNIILGLTKLAFNNLNDELKLIEYLNKIEYSSNLMLDLVNNVLDVKNNNQNNLNDKTFNLEILIENLYSLLKTKSKDKQIILNYQEYKNKYVIGDETKVKQILFNIINNCDKYTKSNEKIIIKTKQINYNRLRYQFIITDTGCGISKKFLKNKLFKLYERENKNKEGIGIGLTIVKKLVEEMNGKINITSKLNVGTRVLIELEFKKPQVNSEINLFNINTNTNKFDILKNKRVLIVDDNKLNLEMLKELLESKEIKVDIINNADDALNMYLNNQEDYYDFMLIDGVMPNKDGFYLSKKIRTSNKLDKDDIILILMSANKYDILKYFNDFILKPFKFEEILNILFKYS